MHSYWWLESHNGIHNIVRQWYNTGVGDMMAKEVDAVTTKLTLGDVYYQAIFLKLLERQAKKASNGRQR